MNLIIQCIVSIRPEDLREPVGCGLDLVVSPKRDGWSFQLLRGMDLVGSLQVDEASIAAVLGADAFEVDGGSVQMLGMAGERSPVALGVDGKQVGMIPKPRLLDFLRRNGYSMMPSCLQDGIGSVERDRLVEEAKGLF
jgi:hypothetical protein